MNRPDDAPPTDEQDLKRRYARTLREHGIVLQDHEAEGIEVASFGLGDHATTGLGLLVYVNNDRYCAKELVMLPNQTCPEHRHPPVPADVPGGPSSGKRETFRCRAGSVCLYVDGPATPEPQAEPPAGDEAYYQAAREVRLAPGQQYTIEPDTWHWFQAGPDGAVISEFSSTSTDELDVFRDPRITR